MGLFYLKSSRLIAFDQGNPYSQLKYSETETTITYIEDQWWDGKARSSESKRRGGADSILAVTINNFAYVSLQ